MLSRACPTSKLGQQQHRGVHLPLNGIHPAGGPVPQTDVVIQRKGPVLIWARAPDGMAYTRTQKAHAQDAVLQEAHVCKVRPCKSTLQRRPLASVDLWKKRSVDELRPAIWQKAAVHIAWLCRFVIISACSLPCGPDLLHECHGCSSVTILDYPELQLGCVAGCCTMQL